MSGRIGATRCGGHLAPVGGWPLGLGSLRRHCESNSSGCTCEVLNPSKQIISNVLGLQGALFTTLKSVFHSFRVFAIGLFGPQPQPQGPSLALQWQCTCVSGRFKKIDRSLWSIWVSGLRGMCVYCGRALRVLMAPLRRHPHAIEKSPRVRAHSCKF